MAPPSIKSGGETPSDLTKIPYYAEQKIVKSKNKNKNIKRFEALPPEINPECATGKPC